MNDVMVCNEKVQELSNHSSVHLDVGYIVSKFFG
jgi:hypothetical protein